MRFVRATLLLLALCSPVLAQVVGGGSQIVPNGNLAFMPPNTVKCNPGATGANPKDCVYAYLNVMDFGATGNGVTDDTVSINNTIGACPNTAGCIVLFPGTNSGGIATYKVSSSLVVGNGTTSSVSTKQGIILQGLGNPASIPSFGPYNQATGPIINWAGGTNTDVIRIAGPLMGWGVNNLKVNCGSTTGVVGLRVISGQFGDSSNNTLQFCSIGIDSVTVATFGGVTITDSFHNYYRNTNIVEPNIVGAIGILLTGNTLTATSNTDFNEFFNTSILVNNQAVSAVYGIYIQQADNNQFYGTHLYGGNASSTGVLFDYTVSSTWPASNQFYDIDPANGNGAGNFINNGTPGVSAAPNYIYGLAETNGAACPVGVANLTAYCSHAISFAATGNGAVVQLLPIPVAISSLPACGASTAGSRATVNNAQTTPTYLGAVSTTGAVTASVFCNGSGWVYD